MGSPASASTITGGPDGEIKELSENGDLIVDNFPSTLSGSDGLDSDNKEVKKKFARNLDRGLNTSILTTIKEFLHTKGQELFIYPKGKNKDRGGHNLAMGASEESELPAGEALLEALLANSTPELFDRAAEALEARNERLKASPGFRAKANNLKRLCYCCRKMVDGDHFLRNCDGECPKCHQKVKNGVLKHLLMDNGEPCIFGPKG